MAPLNEVSINFWKWGKVDCANVYYQFIQYGEPVVNLVPTTRLSQMISTTRITLYIGVPLLVLLTGRRDPLA